MRVCWRSWINTHRTAEDKKNKHETSKQKRSEPEARKKNRNNRRENEKSRKQEHIFQAQNENERKQLIKIKAFFSSKNDFFGGMVKYSLSLSD